MIFLLHPIQPPLIFSYISTIPVVDESRYERFSVLKFLNPEEWWPTKTMPLNWLVRKKQLSSIVSKDHCLSLGLSKKNCRNCIRTDKKQSLHRRKKIQHNRNCPFSQLQSPLTSNEKIANFLSPEMKPNRLYNGKPLFMRNSKAKFPVSSCIIERCCRQEFSCFYWG